MQRAQKIGVGVGGAGLLWCATLVAVGYGARGCAAEKMRARLGESLDAQVTIGAVDLALVRGHVGIDDLVIDREHDGHLHIEVQRIDAGIAALGAAAWDRDLGVVHVRGVQLSVSAWGVLHIKPPKRPPVHLARLIVDDADLELVPLAAAPELGRLAVHINHAVAGPTTLRTGLSWVLALEELDARLDLPAGVTVRLTYAHGRLGASGGMFGDTPVTVPFTLPVADGLSEGKQLLAIGREAAEQLALARAETWLRRKTHGLVP